MVATLANGYEGRDARLSESPQRQTRDNPINVLGRFRLDHESQGNTTSNGSATHERLVRDELVEPRERRKDDLLDERPTCVRRRHVPGFHMVDFDQEKHETSRCICLAPRPPRNRRAVYIAPVGSDKKARACARRRWTLLLCRGLLKALEFNSVPLDPAADWTHRPHKRTGKGGEAVLDPRRRQLMNAPCDQPATLQGPQRFGQHSLRHSGHAAPQLRVPHRAP